MAKTVTFQPPGGEGYWETPADWSDGTLPDATDDVVISSAYAIVDTPGDVAANVTLEGATQLQVWTGGTLTVGGTIDGSGLAEPSDPYGIFMLGAGTLAVAGGIFDTGIFAQSGVIEASVTGGTLISEYAGVTITGALSGVAVDVSAGSLTLDGSVDAATTIAFEAANNGADLVLAATAPLGQFDGVLADWATNSTIDLGGIAWLPGTTVAQLSGDGETLTVSDGGSPLATIHFAAPETGMSFYTESDGGAGTDIVSATELVDTLGTVADWNDAGNWKPGFVPGPGDNVVVASAGLLQTLTVGAAATSGTLTLGGTFTNPTLVTLAIAATGTLTVATDLVVNVGTIDLQGGVLDAGTIDLGNGDTITGFGTINGSVLSNWYAYPGYPSPAIIASGGTLEVNGNLSGTVTYDQGQEISTVNANPITIESALLLGPQASGYESDGIFFANRDGLLSFAPGLSDTGTLYISNPGATIDLQGDPWHAGVTEASFCLPGPFDTGTLVISDAGTIYGSFAVGGDEEAFGFLTADDGHGGTEVIAGGNAPCFTRGTMILTPSGEAPVETLHIGDAVSTHTGATRRVKWIGTRAYAGPFFRANRDLWPIRIRAHALGANGPHRDLLVSPHHALFIDGLLIPAEQLVNGVSVVQEDGLDAVEYFHIELDSHDVLLAEGAPAESFVDHDSRMMFHNAAEFAALYPDAENVTTMCAPRAEGGEVVRRIWRRIADRAGIGTGQGALRGRLDAVERWGATGWAAGEDDAPVWVTVTVDGMPVARGLANRFRPDLAAAKIGRGWHGFRVPLPHAPDPARPHRVAVRREADGVELPGSPILLPASAAVRRAPAGDARASLR